jgi:outer membrane protein assembly factor BamB
VKILFNAIVISAGCGILSPSAQGEVSKTAQENWPQWRGPLVNGVAPLANPPSTWSETSHVKWKIKLPGEGAATPIIWGDQILIQAAIPAGKKVEAVAATATPGDSSANPAKQSPGNPQGGPPRGGGGRSQKPTEVYQFALLSVDRQTGTIRWQKVAREELPHEGHHQDHGFSSYSPVTDGTHVLAFFGSRGLHCYDMQGNLRWSKNLGRMQTKMGFGEGSSPALLGNIVVVNWDHEGDDFVAAFEKETGKELWRVPRQEDTSWSTPLIVEHENKLQVVTAATSKIRSYDLSSGKLLWECSGLTPNAIPTPVAANGVVYAMSGFRGNAVLAIQLGGTGDLTGTDKVLWKYGKSTPYVPSPLL